MSETDDPARRLVVSLALVAVGTVGAYRGAYEVLAQQARILSLFGLKALPHLRKKLSI